jgi:hypothetical protein
MHRLATAINNSKDGDGTHLLAHAYEILRNGCNVVGPQFPVPSAHDFLSKKTNLLADCMGELTPVVADGTAGGSAGDDRFSDVAAGAVDPTSLGLLTKRPTSSGVKATTAAKRSRHAKSQAGPDDEPRSITALIGAVFEMGSNRSAAQATNTAVLERQVAMQEADLRLRTFQVLYDQGSFASTVERHTVESAMRAKFSQTLLALPQPLETPAPARQAHPKQQLSQVPQILKRRSRRRRLPSRLRLLCPLTIPQWASPSTSMTMEVAVPTNSHRHFFPLACKWIRCYSSSLQVNSSTSLIDPFPTVSPILSQM